MTKFMKWMGVFAALSIVAWGAVPAVADDIPSWTYTTDWNEGLILGETFEAMNPGDNYLDAGTLEAIHNGEDFLVGNDNPDLNGNHLDGGSGGGSKSHVFTFATDPGDAGAPSAGSYYIQGTADNLGNNFSMGVYNSGHNTQYGIGHTDGWGWSFGPNAPARSGADVFDVANPHTAITRVNVDGGFVTSYSFVAIDRVTGASWGHGGADGVPNHVSGFGTPTLRVYYDRRGGQNIDMDDLRIGTVPWIPEPATFALLGLGSLLMLRRRV